MFIILIYAVIIVKISREISIAGFAEISFVI